MSEPTPYNFYSEYIKVDTCGLCPQHNDFVRPTGSVNYMINLIIDGSLDYNQDDDNSKVIHSTSKANNIIIFKPHEPQYLTHTDEALQRYWMHFSGADADKILQKCHLETGRFYTVRNPQAIKQYFVKIIQERLSNSEYKDIKCTANLLQTLGEIGEQAHLTTEENDSAIVNKAINYIQTNYSNDINIDDLAKLCNLSKYYFIRFFKMHTGISPHTYLTNVRIQCAKDLLKSTNLTVLCIGSTVGYNDPLYFSRIFKNIVHKTPTEYRREQNTIII